VEGKVRFTGLPRPVTHCHPLLEPTDLNFHRKVAKATKKKHFKQEKREATEVRSLRPSRFDSKQSSVSSVLS
jgi:hypothetical protein